MTDDDGARSSFAGFDIDRLAQTYDLQEGERSDLDAYVDLAVRLEARHVVDIGAGTGVLALRLASRGIEVTAVEPAGAMLRVAQVKSGAERVRWVHGTAADIPEHSTDLVTMTANVAQVFRTEAQWVNNISHIYRHLRPGATVAFESRNPAYRAWEKWNPTTTHAVTHSTVIGSIESWLKVLDVALPLVTFEETMVFSDGEIIRTRSTLSFRSADDYIRSLTQVGYVDVVVEPLSYAPERAHFISARRPA